MGGWQIGTYIYTAEPQSDFFETMNSIILRMVAHSRNSEHWTLTLLIVRRERAEPRPSERAAVPVAARRRSPVSGAGIVSYVHCG